MTSKLIEIFFFSKIGTDLRKLTLDGYPKDYLIGVDIEQSYIDCGYGLFKDSPTTCPIQFIIDDLFSQDTQLNKYTNKLAVIHAGSVFHLFNSHETVLALVKRLTQFLMPGGLLVGGHVCTDQSIEYFRESTQSMKFYMGVEEFKQLLSQEGFTQIELETTPRTGDEVDVSLDSKAFWISFCAVYSPSSSPST